MDGNHPQGLNPTQTSGPSDKGDFSPLLPNKRGRNFKSASLPETIMKTELQHAGDLEHSLQNHLTFSVQQPSLPWEGFVDEMHPLGLLRTQGTGRTSVHHPSLCSRPRENDPDLRSKIDSLRDRGGKQWREGQGRPWWERWTFPGPWDGVWSIAVAISFQSYWSHLLRQLCSASRERLTERH